MFEFTAKQILIAFLLLRVGIHLAERHLSRMNRKYWLNPAHQQKAMGVLKISPADMKKAEAYSEDNYKFSEWSDWLGIVITILFIALGGLGYFESLAKDISGKFGLHSAVADGLFFFALLGLASSLMDIPLSYYKTFVIEEKHGFNKQTPKSFFVDWLKGLALGAVLGGILLGGILTIMESLGSSWWFYAWFAMTAFSLITAWIYPTLLAPLFNKFSPLEDGDLKNEIEKLAQKVAFRLGGIFVMDASKRTSHGNAYFTGVFGQKRIVLFDTLVNAMNAKEVLAVLAHELGHFKLHHVRISMIRGSIMSLLTFYLLSLALPLENFYAAFHMSGVSNYGALLVFGLWMGILGTVTQPIGTYLSRRNEFAADRFAKEQMGEAETLASALLKLRETSKVMPVVHPLYSSIYYSHPPMLERIETLRA